MAAMVETSISRDSRVDMVASVYVDSTAGCAHGSIDRSGNFRGGGCSLIVTSSSFESDRLGSAAIE